MVGVPVFKLFKEQVNRRLKVFIVLPALTGIEHIQQGIHVLFFGWGFVVDISNQRLIQQGFRFLPEVIAAFCVPLGIGHDNRDQRQNVGFRVKIDEWVVVHGASKINGVENLDFIPAPNHRPSNFLNDSAFRI